MDDTGTVYHTNCVIIPSATTQLEEVGHGHVIFVCRRIYIEVSVLKSVLNFLGSLHEYLELN